MTDSHTDKLDPNRLFDALRQQLDCENDEALAHALHVEPYLVARIRRHQQPVEPSLLICINEATGINMRELRRMMGDRRAEYRLDDKPPVPPAAVTEVIVRKEDVDDRDMLRRSFEKDDTGLPNFIQWS